MRQIILLSLLLLPLLSKGQNANTVQQLKAMGYEQVDLKALRQQQTAAPCSTCPINKPVVQAPISAAEELQNLKANLPKLKQLVADSQANPNSSAAMRQKHQVALDRSLQRIQQLEQTAVPQPTNQ
jgi:hypothetical protein